MSILVKIVPDPQKGFLLSEASEVFKGLPEISGQTTEEVIEKFKSHLPSGTDVMHVAPTIEFDLD